MTLSVFDTLCDLAVDLAARGVIKREQNKEAGQRLILEGRMILNYLHDIMGK